MSRNKDKMKTQTKLTRVDIFSDILEDAQAQVEAGYLQFGSDVRIYMEGARAVLARWFEHFDEPPPWWGEKDDGPIEAKEAINHLKDRRASVAA